MSYNGSGTFNINTAGQPVVTGTVISSTAFNALTADLGTGLSTALTKDGQTVATARIPFAQGINSSLVTDATSTTTGSIITAGGVGIAKALFVGTTANIAGTTTLAGVTATSITDSGLTSGRVTYAGTAGLLQDSANLTFNGTTLTANTIGAFTLGGTVAGGGNQLNNVIIGTTTPLAGAFTTLSATGTVSGLRGSFAAGNAAGTYALYAEGYTASTPTAYIYRDNTDAVVTLALKHDRADAATAGSWLSLISQFNTVYGSLDFRAASGVVAFNGLVSSALSAAGTSIAVASSTGLAVTGTLSATGTLSGGTSGTGYSFSGSAAAGSLTLDSSSNLLVGGTAQSGTANRVAVFSANKFGLSVIDTTAQAAGVGGALNLGGNYRSAGDAQAFARVAAVKQNSTDADYGYGMAFSVTPNGGSFTEAARIDSSGNLLVGTTSSSGLVSNNAGIVGGILNTLSGTNSIATSATTVATLPSRDGATYIFTCANISDAGATTYNCASIITQCTTALVATALSTASFASISVSGLDIKITSTLATKTFKWSLVRIL